LRESETKSNSAYLHSLFQMEFKKLTGHYYSEIGTYLNFVDVKSGETEQKKANQELSEYLLKLKKSNLIAEEQFDQFQLKYSNSCQVSLNKLL
jgi:hypothetical protein